MNIRKLHPLFGVEIIGIDVAKPIDDATFSEIRAIFEEYSLLLFRGLEDMTDERQVAFSERFGPLQKAFSANPGGGTPFSRQSNIDIRTGEVRSEEHTSELQSLMRTSYAVLCLKKKN